MVVVHLFVAECVSGAGVVAVAVPETSVAPEAAEEARRVFRAWGSAEVVDAAQHHAGSGEVAFIKGSRSAKNYPVQLAVGDR